MIPHYYNKIHIHLIANLANELVIRTLNLQNIKHNLVYIIINIHLVFTNKLLFIKIEFKCN